MQESSGLKPDLLNEIRLFSLKNLNIALNINRSRIFSQLGSKNAGR